jgi:hypothetical protein
MLRHPLEDLKPSYYRPQARSWSKGDNPQIFSLLAAHYHFNSNNILKKLDARFK